MIITTANTECTAGRSAPVLRRRLTHLLAACLVFPAAAATECLAMEYERPVSAAPTAEGIGGGYVTPAAQRPLPRAVWRAAADTGLLVAAMVASAWIVLHRRSRRWLVVLTIGCLVYFGFYRKGCVCPIGAIQNVSVAVVDSSYALPLVVVAFFFLPLLASLFVGRVFCGGVCPIGGIQDLVVLKPLRVPRLLDKGLSLLKYAYLALAVWFAIRPAVSRDFLICRFDPFVGLFRRTGTAEMLIAGGVFLVIGMFVGRPYCRYLCPYGGLLAVLSRFSRRGVSITPDKELDCGLCAEGCPFGAIEKMRAVRSSCLFCARCYPTCPRERVRGRRAALCATAL